MLRSSLCIRLEHCYEFIQKVGRHREIQTLVARAELNSVCSLSVCRKLVCVVIICPESQF